MFNHSNHSILAIIALVATFFSFSTMADSEKSSQPGENSIVVIECTANEQNNMVVSGFSSNIGIEPANDCAMTVGSTLTAWDNGNGNFIIESVNSTSSGVIYTLRFVTQ